MVVMMMLETGADEVDGGVGRVEGQGEERGEGVGNGWQWRRRRRMADCKGLKGRERGGEEKCRSKPIPREGGFGSGGGLQYTCDGLPMHHGEAEAAEREGKGRTAM